MVKVSITVEIDPEAADMLVDWIENQDYLTVELDVDAVKPGEGLTCVNCTPHWTYVLPEDRESWVSEHKQFSRFCAALLRQVEVYA